MTIAVLWFLLYLHVKLEKQATNICLTELSSALLCRALNRNWADAEREMCVHARAEQKLSRHRESERERCVCACWKETEQMHREVCVCTRARWTETEQTRRERERERGREMCVLVLNRNVAPTEREVCPHAGNTRPRTAVPAILGD